MQWESDVGWTESQVKWLLNCNLCSLFNRLLYKKKKKKEDKDLWQSLRSQKTWKNSNRSLIVFICCRRVFTDNPQCGLWSIPGPYKSRTLFGRNITRIHTPQALLLFLHFYSHTHTHTHTHTHRPSTHVSRGLFVQSIPAWHFHSTLKSPPSRHSCAPPSTHPLGRRRGSYLLYRVCFDSTVSIQ